MEINGALRDLVDVWQYLQLYIQQNTDMKKLLRTGKHV